ncbi:MAG: potassium transporter KtrB [Lachnospiraceae bacterium]|nr:potassium transporter KtrB [Lachnospiraceae bacterium]
MKNKYRNKLTTTQIIMLSFLILILAGSVLLAMPFSAANGKAVSYIDALFTATTSVCVTGLVTVPTVSAWSFWGQLVILLLIQAGGLGVITIVSMFMINLHKKIGLGDRMLIQAAFNLNTLSGLVKFVKNVVLGTFLVEGVGALLYMTVFVPEHGVRGVWISVFNAVSAFCNAGMDIISENSLCEYALNPMVNMVTCLLIVFGGIGYIVWWDVIRVLRNFKKQGFACFKRMTLQSKLAISVTVFLIVAGAMAVFILEYNNPLTLGGQSVWDKLQLAFFQSVTTRTAGFATVPQQNLKDATSVISLLLMFIGGSPAGTAGGIKTVTMLVLVASAVATIKNKNEVVLFNRKIPKEAVNKSVAIMSTSFATTFTATILLLAVMNAGALDVIYETVSATATVGLSRGLTTVLDLWGKIIIIITMYLGRIGPISLAIAFGTRKEKQNIISNPTEEIVIG